MIINRLIYEYKLKKHSELNDLLTCPFTVRKIEINKNVKIFHICIHQSTIDYLKLSK